MTDERGVEGVVIATHEQLQEALGGPSTSGGVNTPRSCLLPVDIDWLAASNFCFIATAGTDGSCDVSPRGDEPGFLLVLDRTTVALPERAGNRRGDGYQNLLENGHVGLLFLIPGRNDTIRINGRAVLVSAAPWFDRLAIDGVPPVLAILVTIEEIFYHCVKAFQRTHLWNPDSWYRLALAAPSRTEVAQKIESCLRERLDETA